MQTLENYIILFIFIARKREMRKRKLRIERMRRIVSLYIVINEGSCTFIHYQMNVSCYGLIMVCYFLANMQSHIGLMWDLLLFSIL